MLQCVTHDKFWLMLQMLRMTLYKNLIDFFLSTNGIICNNFFVKLMWAGSNVVIVRAIITALGDEWMNECERVQRYTIRERALNMSLAHAICFFLLYSLCNVFTSFCWIKKCDTLLLCDGIVVELINDTLSAFCFH